MKTNAAVGERLATLLAEARTILDRVRQQQHDTGDFNEDDRARLVVKLATIAGFFEALDAAGYTLMPADLGEQWASLQEDTRDVRYVSERSR